MGLGWRFIKNKHTDLGFNPPSHFDYDLLVIGAGAAGLLAAYAGAMARGKVCLIEANEMGGDCLNTGCVPSKTLISHAKTAHIFRKNGAKIPAHLLKTKTIADKINKAITKIEPHDSKERYEGLGVHVIKAYGIFKDPWHVVIHKGTDNERTIAARSIVIATGASPITPALSNHENADILTSDNLWQAMSNWQKLPEKMVILGGGPIGCELAQSFGRLGVKISIVEMADHILGREDKGAANLATEILNNEGIQLFTRHQAMAFEKKDGQKFIQLKDLRTQKSISLPYDVIISAIGRTPRLNGFGIEDIKLKIDKTIAKGAYLETNWPHIYVAGDVAGPWQFTHAAGYQGFIAGINGLFGDLWRLKSHHQMMPRITFLDPEIAAIGISEDDAKRQEIPHEITIYHLDDLDRAIAESGGEVGSHTGFIKIITAKNKDKILGVTICASHAGEMLTPFLMALNQKKGLKAILKTTFPYPSWSEGAKLAAGIWQRGHIPPYAMRLLDYFHRLRRRLKK